MAEREALTAAYVRSILHYDPKTGIFTWRKRPLEHFKTQRACNTWNSRFAGTVAGSPNGLGYLNISISKLHYKAHRIAWLLMTGRWPKDEIDHRDTDPSNNRWHNLREATSSQNKTNTRTPRNNTSGFKGVYWNKIVRKWWVYINKDCRRHSLGYFDDINEAVSVVTRERMKKHGEYARVE